MADFWVKIEKSTPDKPEIFEIAELLNLDPDAVMGKLVRVWCWLDSNSENGHIKSVTPVLINRLTNCDGFADAMRTVGWLDENEIPNFDRHLGENAKKRAKDAERKRKSRNCHTKNVTESGTESGLDKSRVDKDNNIKNKQKVTPLDFSLMNLSDEEIKEVKRIRKANKGGAITQRVINALAKEFSQARSSGMTTDEILTEWETRGWKSFKSEWVKQKQTGGNYERHDTTRLSAVDRSREAINRKRKERGLAPLTRDGYSGETLGEAERDVRLQVPDAVRGDSGRCLDSVLIEHRGQEDSPWPPKMPR